MHIHIPQQKNVHETLNVAEKKKNIPESDVLMYLVQIYCTPHIP